MSLISMLFVTCQKTDNAVSFVSPVHIGCYESLWCRMTDGNKEEKKWKLEQVVVQKSIPLLELLYLYIKTASMLRLFNTMFPSFEMFTMS